MNLANIFGKSVKVEPSESSLFVSIPATGLSFRLEPEVLRTRLSSSDRRCLAVSTLEDGKFGGKRRGVTSDRCMIC